MLTDDLLARLCFKGEGSDLDYKAERYPFAGATDEEKSELLKDILAMANAHREGTAYILIGFRESPPHPAQAVGLPVEGAIDDSRIQQFVNEKLESKLEFRYEERIFEGKHIAVISIPKQPRPFYLKKGFGKLDREKVYIRRGSSTSWASPRELVMMGVTDQVKESATFELALLDSANNPLADSFERSFLIFEELPDYGRDQQPAYLAPPNYSRENRNYWREGAEYLQSKSCLILIRLSLANRSTFALSGAKLEVTWATEDGLPFKMLTAYELPDVPHESWSMPRIQSATDATEVDEDGPEPVYESTLGSVRPGETRRAGQDLAFLPMRPGAYRMKIRVLANEIAQPRTFERTITVTGECKHVSFEELGDLLDGEEQEE
jgi:hypothetical protein